jgi:excinuclease ABC subunit B
MRQAMDETARRRHIQQAYNEAHGITPESIKKHIPELEYQMAQADYLDVPLAAEPVEEYARAGNLAQAIQRLEIEMKAAAKNLEFERAAGLRDRIRALKKKDLDLKEVG